jgi:hypothetical protein
MTGTACARADHPQDMTQATARLKIMDVRNPVAKFLVFKVEWALNTTLQTAQDLQPVARTIWQDDSRMIG